MSKIRGQGPAGVQALINRLLLRHRDQKAVSADAAPRQALTVVVPTDNGPALVQQVIVGADEQVDIVRIVETLVRAQSSGD